MGKVIKLNFHLKNLFVPLKLNEFGQSIGCEFYKEITFGISYFKYPKAQYLWIVKMARLKINWRKM